MFAGSCIVSQYMKKQGYKIISNDFLYFSYVLARGTIGINSQIEFKKIKKELKIQDPFVFLNNIDIKKVNTEKCFIYRNYSPNKDCSRMYFQNENALRIDLIRQQIELWKVNDLLSEDEYYYLLAALLYAVPFVANITGTFGAFLKFWDKRTFDKMVLVKPVIAIGKKCTCYNKNYLDVLKNKTDIIYADPPYNSREYLPNYHILETIAKYDYPVIKGITGLREYKDTKSVFCKKNTVRKAFEDLICNANSKYVLISYNNEGLISTEELIDICTVKAKPHTFKIFEFDYRRYRNKTSKKENVLKEQLYLFEK